MRHPVPMIAMGLALAALMPAASPASADALRVLLPAAGALVSGSGVLTVVVELDSGIVPTDARVRLNGADLRSGVPHARTDGVTVVHWSARLAPGANTFDVTLGDPASPRVRVERAVFYREAIFSIDEPPRTFRRQPFHVAASETACRACHRVDPVTTDAAPGAPERSTCHGCHREKTAMKAVHGPAALWACTKCHDPATTPARYATPSPVMPLCFGCHEEQRDWFWNNKFRHGPTATGMCTICHDSHGSSQAYFLKKAAWDLCTTCHAEKGTGRHVVAWGPGGQTHPTRHRADPVRPERELSCASCHNPHAAPGAKLWNFGVTRWGDLCVRCHQSLGGG